MNCHRSGSLPFLKSLNGVVDAAGGPDDISMGYGGDVSPFVCVCSFVIMLCAVFWPRCRGVYAGIGKVLLCES